MSNPYSVSSAQAGGGYQPMYKAGPSSHPMEPLHAVAGWVIFLGWVFIVMGVIYCLTIIGIIIGWLPIWIGILLKSAGEALNDGFRTGNQAALHSASKNLGTYFVILGILTLIGVIINVLYIGFIVVMIFLGVAGAAAGM